MSVEGIENYQNTGLLSSNASEAPKEENFLLLKAQNTLRQGFDLNSGAKY